MICPVLKSDAYEQGSLKIRSEGHNFVANTVYSLWERYVVIGCCIRL